MHRKSSIPMLVLPLALCLAGVAWAGPHGGPGGKARAHPQPAQQQRGQGREGLSDSVRRVERTTQGRVLSAEQVPYDGRNVNRIKVVDRTGRVRVIMDDPDRQPPSPPAPARGDDN
jgi:hypothetical protein